MDQVVGGVGRDNNEKVNTVPFMSQAGKQYDEIEFLKDHSGINVD